MSQLTGGRPLYNYDSMFVINRRSKTWVTHLRREDIMKKEANYMNINCFKCCEHVDATQYMNPAKKHIGLIDTRARAICGA